jgi:hypothetical protein
MPKRSRTVQPRQIIDMRNLTVQESYGKHESSDPGLYNQDIFKKDPREKQIVISVSNRLKEVNPEGVGAMRPGPGDHEPDLGLFGPAALGRGVAHPKGISRRRNDVMRSSYSVDGEGGSPSRAVSGVWSDSTARKQESRASSYQSECSFPKKEIEPRRATGKNMHSTVQHMQYHFRGRQSSGSLRFPHKN